MTPVCLSDENEARIAESRAALPFGARPFTVFLSYEHGILVFSQDLTFLEKHLEDPARPAGLRCETPEDIDRHFVDARDAIIEKHAEFRADYVALLNRVLFYAVLKIKSMVKTGEVSDVGGLPDLFLYDVTRSELGLLRSAVPDTKH